MMFQRDYSNKLKQNWLISATANNNKSDGSVADTYSDGFVKDLKGDELDVVVGA